MRWMPVGGFTFLLVAAPVFAATENDLRSISVVNGYNGGGCC
jgi:hypothetical protein